MAVQALPTYTAADSKQAWFNAKCRKGQVIDMTEGLKFAVVLLEFDPSTTRDDYASMATTVKSHAKIDDVQLLLDGVAPAVEADETARLAVEAQILVRDNPAE